MLPILAVLLHYYNVINAGDISSSTVQGFITTEAVIQGVNPQLALAIAKAESGDDPTKVSDHGTSYGAWQIHLPAHPDISKAQAENLIFSTEWSIEQLKEGNCAIWTTCPTNGT